jgi:hypothetical protein
MNRNRAGSGKRFRCTWLELCVQVVFVAFLYLTHACLVGNAGTRTVASALERGLGAASETDPGSSIVHGENGFSADAVLPRAQDTDPFLAFVLSSPPLVRSSANDSRPCLSAGSPRRRAGGASRPGSPPSLLLRFLAHAVQPLC